MQDIRMLREQLDQIDREIIGLLEKRLEVSREVARWKRTMGLPVLDAGREERVLETRAAMLREPERREDVRTLFRDIMAMSRAEQETVLQEEQKNA